MSHPFSFLSDLYEVGYYEGQTNEVFMNLGIDCRFLIGFCESIKAKYPDCVILFDEDGLKVKVPSHELNVVFIDDGTKLPKMMDGKKLIGMEGWKQPHPTNIPAYEMRSFGIPLCVLDCENAPVENPMIFINDIGYDFDDPVRFETEQDGYTIVWYRTNVNVQPKLTKVFEVIKNNVVIKRKVDSQGIYSTSMTVKR